jgi:hypothetical protein
VTVVGDHWVDLTEKDVFCFCFCFYSGVSEVSGYVAGWCLEFLSSWAEDLAHESVD